ncbi:MAG: hypothetical protein FWG82_05865 [Oscillospiraceae bacterium]|nr:hypothetical protein [Oscillospiraceae bacterium]
MENKPAYTQKKAIREAAQKKKKQQKMLKNGAILLAILAVIGTIAFIAIQSSKAREGERVYDNGTDRIVLQENGTFSAALHAGGKSGTYTQEQGDEVIHITFTTNGQDYKTTLSGPILTLPVEWDDGHGHGSEFRLKK